MSKNRDAKKFHLLIAVVLVALGFSLFNLFRNRESVSVLVEEVPALKKVLPAALVNPVVPPQAEISPEEAAGGGGVVSSPLKSENFLCHHVSRGIYLMPYPFFQALAVSRAEYSILLEEESRCLEPSQSLQLAFTLMDVSAQVPWLHVGDAKVQVEAVTDYPRIADALGDNSKLNFGFASRELLMEAETAAFGERISQEPVRLVKWRIESVPRTLEYPYPVIHPLADEADSEQRADGATVVNIDPRGHTREIPGAVKLPVVGEAVRRKVYPYSEVAGVVEISPATVREKIPRDRPVVVVPANSAGFTGYNFVNYLHSLGYRNLSLLKEGVDGLGSKDYATPTSVEGIKVVEAAEVFRLLVQKDAVIFDNRAADGFARASLPGAISAFYREKYSAEGEVLTPRSAQMRSKDLITGGDQFSLPTKVKKGTTLLFFGGNEEDWRPLKAAIYARDQDLGPILWYRRGYEDWRYRGRFEKEYAVVPNSGREVSKLIEAERTSFAGKSLVRAAREKEPARFRVVPQKPVLDESYKYRLPNVLPPSQSD